MQEEENNNESALQVAWAVLRLHKPTFTYTELRETGAKIYKETLNDWQSVLTGFEQQGYFHTQGDLLTLTAAGEEYTDDIRGDYFGEELVKNDESKVYHHLCQELYGQDLGQYSMTTMEQLEKLIQVLKLAKTNRILDIGCGVGRISEYLADVTGANVSGLDFARPAVRKAQERTRGKAGQLNFAQGNLNRLELVKGQFDTIVTIDSLYFASDLPHTISQMKNLLDKPGQMGLFWSELLSEADTIEQLEPDKTRLARALQDNQLTYQTYDFTDAEKQHWRQLKKLVGQFKPEFEAEGSLKLYQSRLEEAESVLGLVEADRISRYIYHVRL